MKNIENFVEELNENELISISGGYGYYKGQEKDAAAAAKLLGGMWDSFVDGFVSGINEGFQDIQRLNHK